MNQLAIIIATGFYSGFSPIAPGTCGTLVGTAVLLILTYFGYDVSSALWIYTLAFGALAFWSAWMTSKFWPHDDQRIVVDEIIGLFVSLLFLPVNAMTILIATVIFRFFDIFKPLGIKKFDQIDSWWAVMVDDIMAGVYTSLLVRLILEIL